MISNWREHLKDLRSALVGRRVDYTEVPLGRALVLLAIPMVLEMSMQSVFAVVDVFFVGMLGAAPVAVVGITDSLLTLVFAVALGLSMATTALVARRIGERRPDLAARVAFHSLLLGLGISIPTGLLGIWLAPDLLQLLGLPADVIELGSGFTRIMLGGNFTIFLLFLINAIFRGAGDAVGAMRALWLANLVNIVLDPLMIFGLGPFPAMGLAGAAWATNIGRGLGVVYQLFRLTRKGEEFRIGRQQIQLNFGLMRSLFRIGWVGMFQYLVGTASWLAMMRILALFGGQIVAGYTIAIRIVIFVLLPSWGLGNAAATLVGQNLGARKPERAEQAVWFAAFTNSLFLGSVAVLFQFLAPWLVGLFSDQPEVLEAGTLCLRITSLSYLFLAFGMVTVQAFNGAGDTTTPTWVNLISYWILQIPLAFVLAVVMGWGPKGVFIAIATAQSFLAVLAVFLFRRGTWKKRFL